MPGGNSGKNDGEETEVRSQQGGGVMGWREAWSWFWMGWHSEKPGLQIGTVSGLEKFPFLLQEVGCLVCL